MKAADPDPIKAVIRDFRRDQIIGVAQRVFGERGTIDVSVDEIASEAGVARSTVYVYFANRDELLRTCLTSMEAEFHQVIDQVTAQNTSPKDRLQAIVAGLFEQIDAHPAFFRLVIATQAAGTDSAAAALDQELSSIGLRVQTLLESLICDGSQKTGFQVEDPVKSASFIGQLLFGAFSVRAAEVQPQEVQIAARANSAPSYSVDSVHLLFPCYAKGKLNKMHFDLWVPTASPFATPEYLKTLGKEADDRAIHRIWVGEHAVQFGQYQSEYPYSLDGKIPMPKEMGMLEPLAALSFIASITSQIRLGTAMLLLPQRNPVYTAKEVSTLDWLSGGRVDFGIGVGWLREEFDSLNVEWNTRGKRTDEYLQVIKSLWEQDPSSFRGSTYTLPECSMFPKPIQDPHPPIHIGGESKAALRRVARFGDGWHTFHRLPEELAEPILELEHLLDEEGRSRRDIEITVCPYFHEVNAERIEAYQKAGADALAVMFFAGSVDDVARSLDDLISMVEAVGIS